MDSEDDANLTFVDAAENCSLYTICAQNATAFDVFVNGLTTYYTPILIVFGCLGNILSIIVFYLNKIDIRSASVYLSTLALSDTLFLLQLFPPWLNYMEISNVFYRRGVCQLVVYTSYVSCFCSTWTVVAFTVERFVAVLYPLQRSLICTVQRAKYIVLALVLASLILNIPVLHFTTSRTNECNVNNEYLNDAARFNWVDTAISFTVPLAAIIILNARIMAAVCRLERGRRQLLKVDGDPGLRQARLTQSSGGRSQTRVTRMLLLVSSVFVVLNLPAYTMRLVAYSYDMDRDVLGDRWPAYQQLALAFFNTNFGINFMLYCLSGQNFRRAVWQAIPWLRRRRAIRKAAAARRTTCNPVLASSISGSYVSATTEGANTISMASMNVNDPAVVRRHRSEPVIKRWTFDNSRQRRRIEQPSIEMDTFNRVNYSAAATEHTI